MRQLLLGEEGGVAEWLVAALIIGLGSMPIMVALADAVLQKSAEAESAIREVVESGY